jgi:protein TonB
MDMLMQRASSTNHLHRWWFVLLSITLHIPLILEWSEAKIVHLGADYSTPITVTILSTPLQPKPQTEQRGNKRPERITPARQNSPKDSTLLSTVSSLTKTASTKPDTYKTDHNPVSDIQKRDPTPESNALQEPELQLTTTRTPPAKLVEQRLLSEIRIEFSHYFKYPPRAQRQQLEGIVVLSFRLDATGTIQDITVAKSSGHGILDRAAKASLNRVAPLSGVPESGVSFELPIIYKLT